MRTKTPFTCPECGGTELPRFGGGKCRRCYMREYRESHREQCRAYARKWMRENGKAQRSKQHFDGVREQVLERDGNKCVRCGSQEKLTVHHKDRSGRGSDEHNNSPENLETLCRRCHAEEHRQELLAARPVLTHCKRGHARSVYGRFNGRQWVCKECIRIRQAGYRQSKEVLV